MPKTYDVPLTQSFFRSETLLRKYVWKVWPEVWPVKRGQILKQGESSCSPEPVPPTVYTRLSWLSSPYFCLEASQSNLNICLIHRRHWYCWLQFLFHLTQSQVPLTFIPCLCPVLISSAEWHWSVWPTPRKKNLCCAQYYNVISKRRVLKMVF